MKARIAVLSVVFMLLCSTVLFAATANGDFKGFPIIKIEANGEIVKSDVPAVNFFGRTVLPVRAVSESLEAIVNWDGATSTVSILKPDVNIIWAENIEESSDGTISINDIYWSILLSENPDMRYFDFYVYTETGPLPAGVYNDRIIITDPDNNIIYTSTISKYEASEEDTGLYRIDMMPNVNFAEPGIYKFEFQLKQGNEFVTVKSKEIPVSIEE